MAQTQECCTCGAKVRSVVTQNNNNYGSIQHSLVGEYPNSHAYGVRNNSRPTHPSWPSKERGGGGEGENSWSVTHIIKHQDSYLHNCICASLLRTLKTWFQQKEMAQIIPFYVGLEFFPKRHRPCIISN